MLTLPVSKVHDLLNGTVRGKCHVSSMGQPQQGGIQQHSMTHHSNLNTGKLEAAVLNAQAGVALGLAKTVAVRFPSWGPDFAALMV